MTKETNKANEDSEISYSLALEEYDTAERYYEVSRKITEQIKNAQKFLEKGDKVKFTIRFKGRELQHSSLGSDLMEKIKLDMQSIGRVELEPKFDGKQMIMVIQPL